MKLKKIHWKIIGGAALLIISFSIFQDSETEKLLAKVQKGVFKIEVNNSGELIAKNSVDIKGPSKLRSHGIDRIKISKLIAEGTYVQTGDLVAQLEQSCVSSYVLQIFLRLELRIALLY